MAQAAEALPEQCREQSLRVISPLLTELSRRPARPVSAEDLPEAEWEHCASAAAVRNQVPSKALSAEALSAEEHFNCSLARWHQCRCLYLCAPRAGRPFHRALCSRQQGREECFLMEKRQDPSRQNKSRAEQLYQGYLALENECKSEKTKAVLQNH